MPASQPFGQRVVLKGCDKMRLNKFACILFSLLLVLLTGCSGKAGEVKQADFSFNLPEGYSLSDVTDESCNLVSDEGGAIIGVVGCRGGGGCERGLGRGALGLGRAPCPAYWRPRPAPWEWCWR